MIKVVVILGTIAFASSTGAQLANDRQPFDEARKLESAGRSEEAFRKYLAIAGGEFAAAALARGEAAKFLTLIQQDPQLPAAPRALLVEAELLLASGRMDEAKLRFHTLAATAPKIHWDTGQPGYYPVEPPATPGGGDDQFHGFAIYQPALPFCYGPGSHRDNWLLRRLIALDLTDDAAREFARLWESHRSNTRPCLIEVSQYDAKSQTSRKLNQVVHPPGFNSYGLQFALDYAFFLKRADRAADALAVLLEPLRVMDMDLNPNLTHPQPLPDGVPPDYPIRNDLIDRYSSFGPGRVGVARKEFIRLAHGEFKRAGKEAMLIDDLQQQIDRGENRARRVLAQVKAHQGQGEEALTLELDFIKHGAFNDASATYRRGLVFDSYQKPAGAITEFEQVMAAQPGPMNLPDPEERISENPYQQASAEFRSHVVPPGGRTLARGEVRERLLRLFAAVGRTDRVLDTQLEQFEADEGPLENLEQIGHMATRFKAAGQEERFSEWAKKKMGSAKSPLARANLAWQQLDYPAAIAHAAAINFGGYNGWQLWQDRFAKLGREQEREFMRAVVMANPQDAVARLGLLDLEDHLDGPEAIAALEALLATNADQAFPRGKGAWNRTNFHNYLDLAYRLLRLYEKNQQLDNLRALGLRLAKGDKPFEKFDQNLYQSYGANGLEEFGNACLALTIQHAHDKAYQAELAAALLDSRWTGARTQLARRMEPAPDAGIATSPAPPWSNVPSDVRLIASCESVSCVARDERYVYAGQPWGVAVYDFNGAPVTRIALGSEVTALVVTGKQIWAGTPDGLFRIAAGTWSINHEALGLVTALAPDGEQLWIGVRGSIMLLDRNTLALRTFSAETLGFEQPPHFNRFAADDDYVWADGDSGLLRYDRATDAWSAPEKPAHLIGIIDGQLWADVYLDDEMRHRPARVDRKTLRMTPIQMSGKLTRDQRMINASITFHGHDQGKIVFAADHGRFVFDADSNTIRRMPVPDSGMAKPISDALPLGLPLPDGTLVRSGLIDHSAGLFCVTTDGQSRRVSQTAWPDGLRAGARASRWEERWPGDAVWAVLFDDTRQQEWLGVGAGLAILRRDATTLQHFGSSEGVCCGPVSDGISLDGKLYFASGWDDARGGLTVFDPQTRVFTPFLRAAGMDTDMVVGLEAKDGQLELRYGVEYLRDHTNNNPIWRQCRPGRFDPASGQFTSGGEPEFPPREVAEKRGVPATVGTLPFLGGPASRRYEHDGKTWLCGSRGLVVFPGNDAPAPTIAALNAQRAPDLTQVQREKSKRTEIPKKIPLDLLRKLVAGPNKYVRANALAAAYGPVMMGQDDGYVTVIAACMKDPYSRVRTTAVFLLANSKSDAALPPLRLALDDNDPAIRAVAAVTLAKRGELPALSFFEDILRRRDGFSSIPFGEISNIGVDADNKGTRAALAPYADRKVFELLVSYPPDSLYYNKNHYAPLGAALRKHPDAAAVLLAVQDAERHGLLRDYVQRIFQQAGKELLPLLYDALAGNDRVVRSNAARACGAIGDPSSIPPLIQALDMESGLARASIVWALGELKANEAVPILIELHQDARNAEHNRQTGAGYMEQQASSANREAYTALRNLDAIASDWEELKVTALRRPRDPRRDEELLTPETVLEALRKIGSAAAPQFYRTLAAATASNDRAAAAVGLAEVTDTSREMNLTILRNLLGDPDPGVRLRARVSLMLHGESAMDGPLRDRLRAGDHSERWEILGQLERLPGPLLELFRKDIEAIASNTSATESLRRRAAALLGK